MPRMAGAMKSHDVEGVSCSLTRALHFHPCATATRQAHTTTSHDAHTDTCAHPQTLTHPRHPPPNAAATAAEAPPCRTRCARRSAPREPTRRQACAASRTCRHPRPAAPRRSESGSCATHSTTPRALGSRIGRARRRRACARGGRCRCRRDEARATSAAAWLRSPPGGATHPQCGARPRGRAHRDSPAYHRTCERETPSCGRSWWRHMCVSHLQRSRNRRSRESIRASASCARQRGLPHSVPRQHSAARRLQRAVQPGRAGLPAHVSPRHRPRRPMTSSRPGILHLQGGNRIAW
mmetsp:Transcript_14673/g.51085  ORF Transcript_14673/g.51085 Transcript_14673/m.51085 type:complete len:294 (-) Transcript_14673:673-1554(-)